VSRPSLANFGIRAKLAVVLRLAGWNCEATARILGVRQQYSSLALQRAGVPYRLTTDRAIQETRCRRRGAP